MPLSWGQPLRSRTDGWQTGNESVIQANRPASLRAELGNSLKRGARGVGRSRAWPVGERDQALHGIPADAAEGLDRRAVHHCVTVIHRPKKRFDCAIVAKPSESARGLFAHVSATVVLEDGDQVVHGPLVSEPPKGHGSLFADMLVVVGPHRQAQQSDRLEVAQLGERVGSACADRRFAVPQSKPQTGQISRPDERSYVRPIAIARAGHQARGSHEVRGGEGDRQ